MRNLLIIILFTLFANSLQANFVFTKRCQAAYRQMMLFNFDGANAILQSEKQLHPDNKVNDYISSYAVFWKAALNENEDAIDEYEDLIDDVIEAIEDDDQESPYKNFFLSDIYLRGAYLKAMESSYMSAAYKSNKAYNLVQKNREEYPDFIPNKKLIGLMNVGIGTVPKKYTWVLNLFNFEGNVKQGLKELEELLSITANNSDYSYLMSESLLLYSFTMETFEVSKASEDKLMKVYEWESIKKELPHNQFMIFSKASFLKHIKQTDHAIACIEGKQIADGAMHFYYLDFLMGECLLNKLDYSAAKYFKKYATEYHGNSYRRAAYRKWAWTYLLQGNPKKYYEKMTECLEVGNDNRNSDNQATKEAEEGRAPNTSLLKARLLFDGGYYEQAVVMLKKSNPHTFNERENIEIWYRYGRIYDEWGNTQSAILNYERCIKAGRDKEYYFAANAALHLGFIYEKQGKKAEAKKQYEDCLDMDFDEYREGIEQKAKAGLERVDS